MTTLQFKILTHPTRTKYKWTLGVTINPAHHHDGLSRFFFFEWDQEHFEHLSSMEDIILDVNVPCLVHATGKGIHLLSLIPIATERWKKIHKKYKYINPKCPMTTMRIIPNKYQREIGCWLDSWVITPLGDNILGAMKIDEEYFISLIKRMMEQCQVVRYPLP